MTSWTIYGDPWLTTSDLENGVLYQTATADAIYRADSGVDKGLLLAGVRTWVIVYGSPVYSTLQMKIYSSSGGVPDRVLYTSDSRTSVEITSAANAAREIYFTFSPGAVLLSGSVYHFAITGTGYAPTSSSHLAWLKAYPDPVDKTYTPTVEGINRAPYQMHFVGDAF